MTRRNLFYIVVAFIVGVTVWIFFVDRSLKQTQYELVNEVYVQKKQAQKAVTRMPAATAPASATVTPRQMALQQDLENLNRQIEEGEAQRQRQQQSLETLQAQMAEQNQEPTRNATQIRDYQAEILRFLEDIQRNEYAKGEVNRQSSFLLSDQGSSAQVAREQLALQAEKEQVLSDLADDSASLLQEVQGLRQEVQRLQTSQFQQQRSQMSLRSQIQQLQGSLQRQDTTLQGLRSDFVSKQQELESISNIDRTTGRE